MDDAAYPQEMARQEVAQCASAARVGGNGGVSLRVFKAVIVLALPWMDSLNADYTCLSGATLRKRDTLRSLAQSGRRRERGMRPASTICYKFADTSRSVSISSCWPRGLPV